MSLQTSHLGQFSTRESSGRLGVAGAVAAVALAVALVGLAGPATAPAAAANDSSPEITSTAEDGGVISVSFDRNVSAADDGGDVGVDDVDVYVRKAGAPKFERYEDEFEISSNSTTEGKVVITGGPWGDLYPTDDVKVNFTTPIQNASATDDSTNVSVASEGDGSVVAAYDVDGNGVSIRELGAAAADYAGGEISIAELGEVAAAYAGA